MWKLVQNSNDTKPQEMDKTSSATVVYVRKDFRLVEIADGMDGGKRNVWEYMENEIPVDEWTTYESVIRTQEQTENNTAKIDYIAMMTDVEIPEEV